MKKNKRARLEGHGWRVGNAADFLELSAEESALVDTKLALSGSVRERRSKQGLSQAELARRLKSSQSRVAKLEAADPTVSTDLLLRALFALGATPNDVAVCDSKETSGRGVTAVAKMSPRLRWIREDCGPLPRTAATSQPIDPKTLVARNHAPSRTSGRRSCS